MALGFHFRGRRMAKRHLLQSLQGLWSNGGRSPLQLNIPLWAN